MLAYLLIFCSHIDGGAVCQTIPMPSKAVCTRIGNRMIERARETSSAAHPHAACESMKP